MPNDVVQIGPLIVSRAVLDVAGPLVGVVVGGLVTYLTTRAIESKRWEQQKKDKLAEQRREAIGLALEWLAPIESVLTEASLLASRLIRGTMSEDEFRGRFPDLVALLANKDLPARLRVLLPLDAYSIALQIVREVEDLRAFSLISRPVGTTTAEEWTERLDSVAESLERMQQMLSALERQLTQEYKSTFD